MLCYFVFNAILPTCRSALCFATSSELCLVLCYYGLNAILPNQDGITQTHSIVNLTHSCGLVQDVVINFCIDQSDDCIVSNVVIYTHF